ncbi:MAG: transketolase [Deltaproteobacteria bacterium]|nr:MAG: transketolase [Deltaproteobacteria bacterium]
MNLTLYRGFRSPSLDASVRKLIEDYCRVARGDILHMTTLAGSGHPGGSMSSIEMFMTLFLLARVTPDDPFNEERDRIVVSHGHTSPGVYAALGRLGFFPIDQAIAFFRKAGSPFEGHIERNLPGVEWSTGNLGQGLSAGCGFALAARCFERDFNVYVVMGDGEQQKGQISEARRFAVKYGLTNITALVDYNRLQISGNISEVMPQNIAENFRSDGWKVLEVNGHSVDEIYGALHQATTDDSAPYVVIAHTTMGKGVSFMENEYEYHGKALPEDLFVKALEELGLENKLDHYRQMREKGVCTYVPPKRPEREIKIDTGEPRTYEPDVKTDNRSAFGNALSDMAEINACGRETPIAVFDCDLAGSVKTEKFSRLCPHRFFESGIQEHHTAVAAGALSTTGVLTFFADFGVFGICETYNQHRLNDINEANLKLICTHLGIDVGEDGKTHQCIDYLGLLRNLFGFRVIIPADPNQTDRAVRFVAGRRGNFMVGMGRSKVPVITDEEGKPLFGGDYTFTPGKADLVRDGDRGAIFSYGGMLHRAVKAWEILRDRGIRVKVYNLATPLEVDVDAVREAAGTGLIVTYEDHNVRTGLGNCLADVIATEGIGPVRLIKMGVTEYGGSGKPDELFQDLGLAPEELARTVEEALKGS